MTQIINTMIENKIASLNAGGYHYYIDMIGTGEWALFRTPLHKWGFDLTETQIIATVETACGPSAGTAPLAPMRQGTQERKEKHHEKNHSHEPESESHI